MINIHSYIEARIHNLEQIIKWSEASLNRAPEGALTIDLSGASPKYYLRNPGTKGKGIYLRKDQLQVASALAQKDYVEKLNLAASSELRFLFKVNTVWPKVRAEDVYDKLSPARRALVTPFRLSDEDFVKAWEAQPYKGLDISGCTSEIYTMKGEHVRSKSEKIIADLLNAKNIPYRYEAPLRLSRLGTVHPDFTCLNVVARSLFYIEHLGLMDNPEYAERALRKISAYEADGLYPGETLLITFETASFPLNTRQLDAKLDHFLTGSCLKAAGVIES